ncbi:hypothetical protein HDU97_002254 [Phlyctochytrium planicorne]|nr:hypothetical protein HDU97_002254 [Phlyctochytrium planicorne]
MEGLYRFARRLFTTDVEHAIDTTNIVNNCMATMVVDAVFNLFIASPRTDQHPPVEELHVAPAAEQLVFEQQQQQQGQQQNEPHIEIPDEKKQQYQRQEPQIKLPETPLLPKKERIVKRRRARGGQPGTEVWGKKTSDSTVPSTPTSINSSQPSTTRVSSSSTSIRSSPQSRHVGASFQSSKSPASRSLQQPSSSSTSDTKVSYREGSTSSSVLDSNINANTSFARKKPRTESQPEQLQSRRANPPSNTSSGSSTAYSASRTSTPSSGFSTSTYELGPYPEIPPSPAPSHQSSSNYSTSTYELGSGRGPSPVLSAAGVGGVYARGVLAVPNKCDSPASDMPFHEIHRLPPSPPSSSAMRPTPQHSGSAFYPYRRWNDENGRAVGEVEWEPWMFDECCVERVRMWRMFGRVTNVGAGSCEWHLREGAESVGSWSEVESDVGEGSSRGGGCHSQRGEERRGRRSPEDAGVGSSRGASGRYGEREDDFEEVRRVERTRSRSPPRRSRGDESMGERPRSTRREVVEEQPQRRWLEEDEDEVMSDGSTLVAASPEPMDYEVIRQTALMFPGAIERLLREDEGYRRWAVANYVGMTPEEFYS